MPLDFGRPKPEDGATFLAIVQTLHSDSTAPAFTRLLNKGLQGEDYFQLADLFEEISVSCCIGSCRSRCCTTPLRSTLLGRAARAVVDTRRQTATKFCEN